METVASFGKPILAQPETTHRNSEEATISDGTVTVESDEREKVAEVIEKMERAMGFEPTTTSLGS